MIEDLPSSYSKTHFTNRHLASRSALPITIRSERPIAAAHRIGLRKPSAASDLAREAADIILLNSEIEAVPESLGLARATLRTIRQNLFWAFFYNALGVPLAALGFMSPVLSAAAMGVSDLIVIGNALRLVRWRKAV